MNELYNEIEDDIRRERTDRLWNSFGKVMVWMSVAIVVVTIAIVVMQDRRQAHAMEQTTQFIKGLDRMGLEDYKGAIAVFDQLAANESSPYYGLALLRKAQAQTLLSDMDGATKTYQQLAKKDDAFGDLAKMLSAGDNDKPVEPTKGSPFYYSLSEWRGWQLLQQGKKDEAVVVFRSLFDDPHTPHSLRERMAETLSHIAPEKLADAKAAQ